GPQRQTRREDYPIDGKGDRQINLGMSRSHHLPLLIASWAPSMTSSSSSLSAGLLGTPSLGISSFAIQATPLSSTVRKLSSPRCSCGCSPVKPTPRPPSGRSYTQAMCCGLPASTSANTASLPPRSLGSLRTVASGGTSDRIGVTPFISGT